MNFIDFHSSVLLVMWDYELSLRQETNKVAVHMPNRERHEPINLRRNIMKSIAEIKNAAAQPLVSTKTKTLVVRNDRDWAGW